MEKRWLLGLGPPLLGAGLLALLGPQGSPSRFVPDLTDGRQVGARVELRDVAPDVNRRGWIAERGDGTWSYGGAGGGSIRALPDGETAIAIGPRYVASITPRPDGRTRVVLREWLTGAVAARVDAPLWVSAGAFRGDDLVVTGYADAGADADGGLVLIGNAGADVVSIVAPGVFPPALRGALRGDVHVSPNGRLAASYACRDELCETQLVDLAAARLVRAQTAAGFLRTLTDDALIYTDGESKWIEARDALTGRERWRLADSILMSPLAGADRSVTGLTGSRATGWAVARIDADGRVADVTQRTVDASWPFVWTQLSTPLTAVIGSEEFASALSTGRGQADLVEIASGRYVARSMPVLPANQETAP
jgi:hypothetical protein